MAFDPFGGGGGANSGSHVVFASGPRVTLQEPTAPAPSQQQPSFSVALQLALAERMQEAQGAASQPSLPPASPIRMQASAEEAAKALGAIVFDLDGITSPRGQTEQSRPRDEERLAAAAVTAQTLMAVDEAMDGASPSASLGIAKRLPGSPADGYRYMETLRHDQQITDERRAVARKMAQKDDEMAFRD